MFMVIEMKVYVDLLFLLNFAFDFILLLSVSVLLRRRCKIYRLILGALFGALSIFLLFTNINSIELFIFKVVISLIMILISFSYKDIKYFLKNTLYLYMSSIVLGGFLYLLNITFSYKHEGLVFYHSGLSINFIFLIIASPIAIYMYVKQGKNLKNNYSYYYKLNLYFKSGGVVYLTAFLDSGNKLVEPISKKPIILVNRESLKNIDTNNSFKVPFNTINGTGLLDCVIAECISVEGIGIKNNIIVGISDEDFHIDGVNCLINNKIMEGLC